jgi:O-antigen/teichoic acid export membrane protein
MLRQKAKALLSPKRGKDFIIYGVGQAFNLLTPLLVTPYIISVCGLGNFGKVSLGLAVSFFVIVIIDYGVDILGVKDVSINRFNQAELQKIVSTAYLARFILLIAVLSILSVVFMLLPSIANERKLFFLGLPILIGQYVNPSWFLQGMERFGVVTLLNIISKLIYLGGVFLFIKKPEDYVFVNLFWGLGMIISFCLGLSYCVKRLGFKIKNKVSANEVTVYLKNGYKFCISQLFLSFKYYSPIAIISIISGYNLAGFYRVIDQVVSLFRTYLQVVFRFFYPKICYKTSLSRTEGISYWKKINKSNLILMVFMLLVFLTGSGFILKFFKLSQQDIDSIDTIFKTALLIPLMITLTYALEQLIFCFEKREQYIKITIATVILNSVIIVVLFSCFQLLGVILALLITEAVLIISYLFVLDTSFKESKS